MQKTPTGPSDLQELRGRAEICVSELIFLLQAASEERSVMQSLTSALWVLLLLIITAESNPGPRVKVKLHDSAVLPCSERCPGLVRWTVFHKRSDVLAECDQTSCRSMKEGYQMIHEEYLKGNISLIITRVDFSMRGWYTCACDRKDVCDAQLQIEPVRSSVEIQPGESLLLELKISDPVELVYNSGGEAGAPSVQICTVEGQSLKCNPEYMRRTSLTPALELRDMKPSDSGVYTVRDTRNDEVLYIYTVSVRDVQQSWIWKKGYEKGSDDGYLRGNSDGYRRGLGIGAVSFGIVGLVLGVILGRYVVPLVLPLLSRHFQRSRNTQENEAADEGSGVPMRRRQRQEEE
ncbi:uncharacterized protein [Salminus brasiliensis]|uniref:uncharacterized protein n=1 Tax=Salminus brasiliensis TaxID=930266 RepID=UPI003B83A594